MDEKRLQRRECLHNISFRGVCAQVLRRLSLCYFSFTLCVVLGEALFQTLIFLTKRGDFSLELAHFDVYLDRFSLLTQAASSRAIAIRLLTLQSLLRQLIRRHVRRRPHLPERRILPQRDPVMEHRLRCPKRVRLRHALQHMRRDRKRR